MWKIKFIYQISTKKIKLHDEVYDLPPQYSKFKKKSRIFLALLHFMPFIISLMIAKFGSREYIILLILSFLLVDFIISISALFLVPNDLIQNLKNK